MPPLNPYISVRIASIIAFLFCAFCAPGAGASTGEIQNHDFKFVSCEITEDSFWVANLLGARYGKEYTMILNENAYNSMCPKFKKGDYVNITYKQDRVADEGDGGEFEAYVLVSYRMISPQQSASNRGADKKDDSSSLANKIVPYVLLGIIILWIIGFIRKLVAVPHRR